MTSTSGKGDKLLVLFRDDKLGIREPLGQRLGQNGNHRVFSAEMVPVDKIYSKLCGQQELVVFYVGRKIGITASFGGRLQRIPAGAAHNRKTVHSRPAS